MGSRTILLLFALFILQCGSAQAALDRFAMGWLWYDDTFGNTLRHNCTTEYNNYLKHHDSGWYHYWPVYSTSNSTGYWVYLNPIITCILNNTDELNKANMASACVLLGLMPTILAYAGSNLPETALLSLRRPLLACLLAVGSPAVPPLRTFVHEDIPKMLTRRKYGMTAELASPDRSAVVKAMIVGIELALSMAPIANVMYTSYELGMKTFVSWSADVFFHPLLWSCITGFVHLWGSMVLKQDVRRTSPPSSKKQLWKRKLTIWADDEFTPCSSQRLPTVVRYEKDTFLFLLLSWWAALLTLAHYIYGTVVFSSTLFISVPEALKILARFLASTLCCRIIVMYELSGMRQVSQTLREAPGLEIREDDSSQ